MSVNICRTLGKKLLNKNSGNLAKAFSTAGDWSSKSRKLMAGLGVLTGTVGTILLALDRSVKASDLELHPPRYPWDHLRPASSLDHASIRRGYQVYKQVCSACHSLRYVAFRELVGVCYTECEAKMEAEGVQVTDGPDATGEMFERPGKLSDRIPGPYKNEEAARAANNGAFPPDLTFIICARHENEDYIFSILLGYVNPPAGVNLREGQNYNPYFLGGAISMAEPLYNDIIQYEDGTPATKSQLAKDVVTFLKWAGEPEHDERQRYLINSFFLFSFLCAICYYYLRHRWSTMKTRQIRLYCKK